MRSHTHTPPPISIATLDEINSFQLTAGVDDQVRKKFKEIYSIGTLIYIALNATIPVQNAKISLGAEPQPLRFCPDPAGGAYKTASPRPLNCYRREMGEERKRVLWSMGAGVGNLKQGLACIDEPL